MKKQQKVLGYWILVLIFLFTSSFAVLAETAGSGESTATSNNYNVMLLIDKSGSMNGTDGKRLALSAACQFVDQMCTSYSDLSSSTKVGIMAFSQSAELIAAPTSLKEEANISFLKSKINEIKYDKSGTGGTDLGVALDEAVTLLNGQSAEGQKNMVVLFTDGYSDNQRDKAVSSSHLKNAFAVAQTLPCEVYVVGLNHDNKITDQGKKEIYNIADTTQIGEGIFAADPSDVNAIKEKVNYLVTDDMGEVRVFYGLIYGQMVGAMIEPLELIEDIYRFSITSGGIFEADVTVYSDEAIHNVTVTAPDGTVQKEDGESYFISGDSYYKVIRIMRPEVGKWQVEVDGLKSYKSYVLKLYGVELAVSAGWQENTAPEETGVNGQYVGKISASPILREEIYKDDAFIQSLSKAKFIVNSSEESYPLTYDPGTGSFIGYFPVSTGTWHITALLENESMTRTASCDLTVNIGIKENKDGSYIYNLGELSVKLGELASWDLNKMISDSGFIIQQVGMEGADVEASYDASKLTVKGLRTGGGNITVSVLDQDGNHWTVSGHITVQFTLQLYHCLTAVLLLFLLLLAVFLVRRAVERCKGSFDLTMSIPENNGSSYYGRSVSRTLTKYPRGSSFSLWKLAEHVLCELEARNRQSGEETEICNRIRNEKGSISEKRIVICRKRGGKKKYHTYKLKQKKRLLDLSIEQKCCYSSGEIEIWLSFKQNVSEFDDESFGADIISPHKKGMGRTPSGKRIKGSFEDED